MRAQTEHCTAIKIMHNREKMAQLQQRLNKYLITAEYKTESRAQVNIEMEK